MSHLYIMQNHVGFIKVGRSANVEARRRALERTDECSIAIVAIIETAGEFEETMHVNLGDHRIIGEWFEGDELCRDCIAIEVEALSDAIGRELPKLVWPYALAEDELADGWLARCEQHRTGVSIDKEIQRVI